MPKSICLGNGHILVLLDLHGQVRDFYFPRVGLENHVGSNEVQKIGVWVDNNLSWLDSPDWQLAIDYQKETMASKITAFNSNRGIELEFTDIVYNEKNIFLRKIIVKNLKDQPRQIKIFFNQQFDIYESRRGNTAYFEPVNQTIIHYKGRRNFVIGGQSNNRSFDDFCIGLHDIEGKEGTYKDAEDGSLTKNPIEHGSVDSMAGFTLDIPAQSSQPLYYWITVAKELKEAIMLHYYVLEKSPEHLLASTQAFWRAWVNKYDFIFSGLDEKVIELFKKSLLIMRTHIDNNGAIIASGDSDVLQYGRDTYSYVWPRDGAFAALAATKTGYYDLTKRYFEFCNDVITDEGYLLHKYLADKALGSSWHPWYHDGKRELAIQEDETALVIYTLWEHYQLSRDLEFIESIYNSLIKKAAEFMVRYRDPVNKLPQSSYDLWEQYFCVSTFTAAAVYGALRAASNFARLLEKRDDESKYLLVAQEIKEAIIKNLYNADRGYFYKYLSKKNDQFIPDPTVDISSPYGIFRFEVLDKTDERLTKAFKVVEEKLSCPTQIGGVARYEDDDYSRVSPDIPGNPWYVTTLWLTQYKLSLAKKDADLQEIRNKLKWVTQHASSAGLLSEQIDPYTGEQISLTPLTWSHAEFILTVVRYLEKLEELGLCEVCNPVK